MICGDTTSIRFPKGARVVVWRDGQQRSSRKFTKQRTLYGLTRDSGAHVGDVMLVRPRNGITWHVWKILALYEAEKLGKTNSLDAAIAIAALGG